MSRTIPAAVFAAVLALPHPAAWAAPCVTACKDEIGACVSSDCQGFTRKALRHCKRACKKTLVQDCYKDLTVCGATTARPPGSGTPPPGGW